MGDAAIGIDFAVPNGIYIYGSWIRSVAGDHRELADALIFEDREDLGETRMHALTPVVRVAQSASDPMPPWTNYLRRDSIHLWRCWREEGELVATALRDGSIVAPDPDALVPGAAPPPVTPVRTEIGASATLIRPSLSVESGELDVYCMLNAAQIGLVRFSISPELEMKAQGVIGRWPAPENVVGAWAFLTPAGLGSRRRVLLVSQSKAGVVVHLLDFGSGGESPQRWEFELPGKFVPGKLTPEAHADDDGSTLAHLLLASKAGGTALELFRVRFPARVGGAPELSRLGSADVKVAPVAAIVMAQTTDAPRPAVDWLVLRADGAIWHNHTEDRPMRPRGIPIMPLQAVRRRNAAYVLCTNPVEGLYLDSMQ